MAAYIELATILRALPEASLIKSDDIGEYAVELAVRGWNVFPLRGKVPAIANPHPLGTFERASCKGECGRPGHGVLDATTEVAQVAEWWGGRYAGANIGARVPESVFVLDVDPRSDGDESLSRIVTEHGELPETLTVTSGRGDGGTHRYFRAPDARLTSRFLGSGIDVKTSTGYCVVPPSAHPITALPYVWTTDVEVAEPPAWLIELLVVQPAPPAFRTSKGPPSGHSTSSIADSFAERATWADVLQPHGWRCLDADGDADGARWLHPTATSACSATVRHGCLFVYSPNTPFEETATGDPRGVTKFRAFATLRHGGDMSAAARVLAGR